MAALIAIALVLAAAAIVVLPLAIVAYGERRPWPDRIRLLRAAYQSQLLVVGASPYSLVEATIADVRDGPTGTFVVCDSASGREALALTAGPASDGLSRLRYWRAEAIPVLLVQDRAGVVEVHGPSGIVALHHQAVPDVPRRR